jgi:hypothetical protein
MWDWKAIAIKRETSRLVSFERDTAQQESFNQVDVLVPPLEAKRLKPYNNTASDQ